LYLCSRQFIIELVHFIPQQNGVVGVDFNHNDFNKVWNSKVYLFQ